MKSVLLRFLSDFLPENQLELLEFGRVPKGQIGDCALKFFLLAKETQKSPLKWAQTITDALKTCPDIKSVSLAGMYLNVSFVPSVLFHEAFHMPLKGTLLQGKNIVLEFSGPNTNKPLHLGHMRNHALGISVSFLLESLGASVHRVNIVNDRGVHICKSLLAYDRFSHGETPESTQKKPDHFVGDYYVRFEQESKKDETLLLEVQEFLRLWESGDERIRALWKTMNDWTLSGHAETYKRQGVSFEKVYKESEFYLQGKDIAEAGLESGVFSRREDGAITIDLSDEGLDEKVILRADGTSIYLTQDLAVASQRNIDFQKPDEMIYVVADEQNYHFQVLFLCLEKLGILSREHLFHLGYGLVHLPSGRMKSREGTVVDADDLMDGLSDAVFQKIKERNVDMNDEEAYTIAEQVMNGAWKFYLLSSGPQKSITFDAESSLSFEGATGPYLQYAGVRIRSLLRKSPFQSDSFENIDLSLFGSEERSLALSLLEWNEALEKAGIHKNPTYIVTYLLELAQNWSRYYAETPLLKAETEALQRSRMALASRVLTVLEYGLSILGIEVPEKM